MLFIMLILIYLPALNIMLLSYFCIAEVHVGSGTGLHWPSVLPLLEMKWGWVLLHPLVSDCYLMEISSYYCLQVISLVRFPGHMLLTMFAMAVLAFVPRYMTYYTFVCRDG